MRKWGEKILRIATWGMVLIFWPMSVMIYPPHFDRQTIFYNDVRENGVLSQKLSLDTSKIKRFYYNKATPVIDRYIGNFYVLLDLNNYFFQIHPREDVSGVSYRPRFPFLGIILLVIVILLVDKKRKRLMWPWLVLGGGLLLLPFLKNMDGWDLILYLPVSYWLIEGLKQWQKLKYGWIFSLFFVIVETWELMVLFWK